MAQIVAFFVIFQPIEVSALDWTLDSALDSTSDSTSDSTLHSEAFNLGFDLGLSKTFLRCRFLGGQSSNSHMTIYILYPMKRSVAKQPPVNFLVNFGTWG